MAIEKGEGLKFEGLRFLDSDKEALLKAGFLIYPLHRWNLADLEAAGLKVKVADDLRQELLEDRYQNRAHFNEVAFDPRALVLVDSAMKPLAEQDNLARSYIEEQKKRLGLKAVGGGISRFADYAEVILWHLKTEVKLLEKGDCPYPSVRTRTRVFPEMVSSQNFVVDIGPFDQDGLNVRLLSRDEADGDIGVWPLLYPAHIPILNESRNP